MWRCSPPKITSVMVTSQKRTVAAAARHEKLVQFVVSSHGALIAAYNCVDSAVFKITYITDGSADSWRTVINAEVTPQLCFRTKKAVRSGSVIPPDRAKFGVPSAAQRRGQNSKFRFLEDLEVVSSDPYIRAEFHRRWPRVLEASGF